MEEPMEEGQEHSQPATVSMVMLLQRKESTPPCGALTTLVRFGNVNKSKIIS